MYQERPHENEDFDMDDGLDLEQFEYSNGPNTRNNFASSEPVHRAKDRNPYDDEFQDDEEFDVPGSFRDHTEFDAYRNFDGLGYRQNKSQVFEYGDNVLLRPHPEYESRSYVHSYTLPNTRRRRLGSPPPPQRDDDGDHLEEELHHRHGDVHRQPYYGVVKKSYQDADQHHYNPSRTQSVAAAMSRPTHLVNTRQFSSRRSPEVTSYYESHRPPRRRAQSYMQSKYEQTRNWVQKDSRERVKNTERVRKFPSPDWKGPVIPLPDYDGCEKGIQFVPSPDY